MAERVGRRSSDNTISAVTSATLRQNAILRDLSAAESARVIASGALVNLPTRFPIYSAGETIVDAYFPINCVLSVVTQMEDGEAIEVGTIGCEGTSAIPLLMGGTTTANDCYCQVPGESIRISAEHFHRLRSHDVAFQELLDRYLQAYVNFLGQLSGCNRLHTVNERCARWLLLSRDRVDQDRIPLTHEYLAMMLGSRRSAVSIALATLRRAGYIAYGSGAITILDRNGLRETTCECYGVARRQFAAFLPPD